MSQHITEGLFLLGERCMASNATNAELPCNHMFCVNLTKIPCMLVHSLKACPMRQRSELGIQMV